MADDVKTPEIVDLSDCGVAELIALVPDIRAQRLLAHYYSNREVGKFAAYRDFADEMGFLYDLACAAPISPAVHSRIKLLQDIQKNYALIFKSWMETEMIQRLESRVNELQADLDSLLHHIKKDLIKMDADRVLNRWKLDRAER